MVMPHNYRITLILWLDPAIKGDDGLILLALRLLATF